MNIFENFKQHLGAEMATRKGGVLKAWYSMDVSYNGLMKILAKFLEIY